MSASSPALAQTYPTKPIKIIVSTSPGGITDILARFLGAHITAKTGQTVVIDNRAGGSGNIAMSEVSRAPPDGYTLGFANTGNITINPFLFSKLNYDPLNDLVPIGPVGTVPLFLTVNASRMPAKTLPEFIAYAKANLDKVSYAGAGAGTTPDLAQSEFARRSGLKLVVVPHRGTGPATQAVIGGDVQVTFVSMGPHIELCARACCACWRRRRPSACPMCRTCRHSPSRASRASRRRPGSRCSPRAARRRRSSISSMPTPAACRRTRRPASGWRRPSSIRCR